MLVLLSMYIPEGNQTWSARIEYKSYGHTKAYRMNYSSPRNFSLDDSLPYVVSTLLGNIIESWPPMMGFDGTLTQFGNSPYGLAVIQEPDIPTLMAEFKKHGVYLSVKECN